MSGASPPTVVTGPLRVMDDAGMEIPAGETWDPGRNVYVLLTLTLVPMYFWLTSAILFGVSGSIVK